MNSASPATDGLTAEICRSLVASIQAAERLDSPFRHWLAREVFPLGLSKALLRLPFAPVELGGLSGKRELHNDQRHYFAGEVNAAHFQCRAVADAFQSRSVVAAIERATDADLAGTYVRLEYAQDCDGFWLQPHTDLGVKRFTMLIYLADDAGQAELGTDIYADSRTWAKRTPFIDNSALVFVPSDNTWHGLERRPIPGVRRSVIMNYVTDAWRERGQLAYPDSPVRL